MIMMAHEELVRELEKGIKDEEEAIRYYDKLLNAADSVINAETRYKFIRSMLFAIHNEEVFHKRKLQAILETLKSG